MTTISTAHTIVNDPLMELGNGRSGTTHGDGGLIIERGDLSNVFLGWDESIAKFHLGTTEATGLSTGNINITTGTLVADISATDISCARLNVNGRVGIGTTNPSKVEVVGETKFGSASSGSLR